MNKYNGLFIILLSFLCQYSYANFERSDGKKCRDFYTLLDKHKDTIIDVFDIKQYKNIHKTNWFKKLFSIKGKYEKEYLDGVREAIATAFPQSADPSEMIEFFLEHYKGGDSPKCIELGELIFNAVDKVIDAADDLGPIRNILKDYYELRFNKKYGH